VFVILLLWEGGSAVIGGAFYFLGVRIGESATASPDQGQPASGSVKALQRCRVA